MSLEVEQQHPPGSTTFFKTCFNGVNALSGVGILSIAYALSSGGWLSIIFFFALGALNLYTSILMQKCMDSDPTKEVKSYPDIGELSFGNRGRAIVTLCLYMDLYLVATGLLIVEGDNMNKLWPDVGVKINGLNICNKKLYVIVVSFLMLPTVWINNLSILSYISASGVVASLITLGSLWWAAIGDGIGFGEKGELINFRGMPRAVSLYSFCYCIHPYVPTLRTSMRESSQFIKVLILCFAFCIAVYTSIAVSGYLMFGSAVLSQITLNMPKGKISSKVATYTTLINPLAKYALCMTPVMDSIEEQFPVKYRNRKWLCMIMRTSLVFSTTAVALLVPFFGYLMALVGATLDIALSIFLPCLCYLKIRGSKNIPRVELVCIGIIMFIGTLVMMTGTYTSISDIITHL